MFIIRWIRALLSLPILWLGQLTLYFKLPASIALLSAAWTIGGDAEVGRSALMAMRQLKSRDDALAQARPLLEPLSRGISIVGPEPRQAHAVKLGGNFLISAMIQALGESFVYAAAQGIDPEAFLSSVNSALFQSPFYAAYGQVMLHPPEQPGATIELGEKDTRLLREAAASRHTRLSLADNLAEIFIQARQAGLGGEDWAVGQYRMAQRRAII